MNEKKVRGYWITLFGHQLGMKQYMQENEADLLDVFRRAAKWVAKNPQDEEAYYDLMSEGYFCPGGRVLAGAGTQHGNVLNCFVQAATVYPRHTLAGVMELAKKLALVTKVGGGNGTSLDDFRPQNSLVKYGSYKEMAPMNAICIHEDHPNAEDVLVGRTQDPEWPDNPVRVERGYQRSYVFTYTEVDGDKFVVKFPAREEFEHEEVEYVLNRLGQEAGSNGSEVIEVADSIENIMVQARIMCELQKQNIFTAVDLSDLRPENSPINGSGGTSSGPQAFSVEIYDNFTAWMDLGEDYAGAVNTLRYIMAPTLRCIRQGGTRRGAGMATIAVDHPEVLNFLTAKDKDRQKSEGDISTYNISIKATDKFLQAVDTDGWVEIRDPLDNTPAYVVDVPGKYDLADLIRTKIISTYQDGGTTGMKIKAGWLMGEIANHAHSFAEPGLMFIDTINKHSASDKKIESTNP